MKTVNKFSLKQHSTESISIRMPTWLLDEIKQKAVYCDVPYQSLIKVWLAERMGFRADDK